MQDPGTPGPPGLQSSLAAQKQPAGDAGTALTVVVAPPVHSGAAVKAQLAPGSGKAFQTPDTQRKLADPVFPDAVFAIGPATAVSAVLGKGAEQVTPARVQDRDCAGQFGPGGGPPPATQFVPFQVSVAPKHLHKAGLACIPNPLFAVPGGQTGEGAQLIKSIPNSVKNSPAGQTSPPTWRQSGTPSALNATGKYPGAAQTT
jgi:hypothetical protein